MTSLRLAAVRLSYTEAAWVLQQAGVPSLAIKGPVTSALLQQPYRESADADLLVPPGQFEQAVRALEGRGWRRVHAGTAAQETATHSVTLQRPTGAPVRTELDLHMTFPGFGVPADRLWRVLDRDAQTLAIGHRSVPALSESSAAVFVVLHAARSGLDVGKPLSDLRRAIEVLPFRMWTAARDVAVELDALAAMSAGLSLLPEGRALAERLALPAPDLEWALRSAGDSSVAMFLVRWWRAPWRERLPMLAREVWPTTAFMRLFWLAPEDRGAVALLRAQLRRWRSLAGRLPAAVFALRVAHQASRRR